MFTRKAKLPQQPRLESPFIVGPFLQAPRYKEPRPIGDFLFEKVTDEPEESATLKLILLKAVDELGVAGDIVEVDRDHARFHLLSSQTAVYASEFNLQKYRELIDSGDADQSAPSSAFVKSTMKRLASEVIVVVVNDSHPWTITEDHVRIAFRTAGYRVRNESITLPETAITGPDVEGKQGKDFAVTLTINGRERVNVRCMLHHAGLPLRLDWNMTPRFILLPEQKQLLGSMPVNEPEEDLY